jgi:PAS domain S-box-containing protein
VAGTMDEGRAAPGFLGELAAVSPDVVCAMDREGRFLAVNAAWERVLGWSSEDLLGRPFLDFVHVDDRARTSTAWARMLEGEPLVDFENRWPTRSGGWRWISWASVPSDAGDHVYATGRDITSRMEQLIRVTESESLLIAAERVARLGSWEWRLHGDVAYLSEELRRIFSVDREEPFGLGRLLDLAHPDDRGRLRREVDRCTVTGEPLDIEYRIVQPDGTERIVRERGECVVEHGEVVRMFGTVQDVTEQRRVEAELRRVAEVEQQAADRLRELDRMKTAFLSAVSHELRTPLTGVQGTAATLRARGASLPVEAREQLEDALVEHAGRLGHLLDGLLDVDRLSRDAVGVERRDVDVEALVRQVVDRSPARDRVDLDLAPRLTARVDPLQLERIVGNLLDNADKYGGSGRVQIVVRRHTARGCRLEVRDEGPGIPAGELGQVFEAFHRIDQDHPRPGTGIGLALVAEFARLHGGAAWAEQPAGRGAHLVVELPGDGLT